MFAKDIKALLQSFGYTNDGVIRFSREPGPGQRRGSAWSKAWPHMDHIVRDFDAAGYVLGMEIRLTNRTAGGGKSLHIKWSKALKAQVRALADGI